MTTVLSVARETFETSPNGCQCVFIRIGNKGLKVYRSIEERDFSYVNQYKLSNMGIAPRVGYKCEVTISGDTHYAFETDCVECYSREVQADLGYTAGRAYRERFQAGVGIVANKMSEANLRWHDDHTGNIGWCEDRQEWLLIDCADDLFGSGTVGSDAWMR